MAYSVLHDQTLPPRHTHMPQFPRLFPWSPGSGMVSSLLRETLGSVHLRTFALVSDAWNSLPLPRLVTDSSLSPGLCLDKNQIKRPSCHPIPNSTFSHFLSLSCFVFLLSTQLFDAMLSACLLTSTQVYPQYTHRSSGEGRALPPCSLLHVAPAPRTKPGP